MLWEDGVAELSKAVLSWWCVSDVNLDLKKDFKDSCDGPVPVSANLPFVILMKAAQSDRNVDRKTTE